MINIIFSIIRYCIVSLLISTSLTFAELVPVNDDALNQVSGQSGITLNAKIILGDESSFVFTNTSGKTQADASASETSYLIVDNIQGALEMEGLSLDLVSDLNNSGKAAFQWTLPKKIVATNLKTTGIYASGTENVDSSSTFLLGLELNGELSLPANTQISVFVVD
jgi:hypothetical protein